MTKEQPQRRKVIKRPFDEILGKSRTTSEAIKAAMGGAPEFQNKVEEFSRGLDQSYDSLKAALGVGSEFQERMDMLTDMGQNPTLANTMRQISRHQQTLDALMPSYEREPDPIMDHPDWHRVNSGRRVYEMSQQLKNFKSPILETNKRLASIESQFVEIRDIAVDSAKIANGLNASAAVFLDKFEQAALSNEKSARIAIWIGAIAVLIAAIMPASQIAYNEYLQAPRENLEAQALKAELAELKEVQSETLQGLVTVLEKSDASNTALLREIKELLAKQNELQNSE